MSFQRPPALVIQRTAVALNEGNAVSYHGT